MKMSRKKRVEVTKMYRSGELKPLRENKKWKIKDVEWLLMLYSQGWGISELAVHFERSEPAICQKLLQVGCYDNAVNHRERGKDNHEDICQCNRCRLRGTDACRFCGADHNFFTE